jgi:hypothetical protein
MKFSIIVFLLAALGSSDILVSSQDQPSPANRIKKASGQKGYVRGSHSQARKAMLQLAMTSPDLVDFHLGSYQNVHELQDSTIGNSNLRTNVRAAGSVPAAPLPPVLG